MLNDWLNKLQNLWTRGGGAGSANAGGADGDLSAKQQPKDALGVRGENLAARELQKKGYRILTRNFKTPVGEIDIVARAGETLVFAEVKTRLYDEPAPEEQVNPAKMHQLTKAAKFYLSRYPNPPPARFDVVAIVWPQGQPPVIRHIENAFEATF